MNNLLTIKQTAARLNLSELYVRRLVRDGKIKAIKLAERAIRIDGDDIDQYLQKQRDK